MKKSLRFFVLPVIILIFCFGLAACKGPQAPDTSAVAGTYYRHADDLVDGDKIADKFLILNNDGTWSTAISEGENRMDAKHTFTVSGNNISFYLNSARTMYGTIQNGRIDIKVWNIVNWVDAVFFLDSE